MENGITIRMCKKGDRWSVVKKQETHLELQPMVEKKACLYRPKMPEKNHEGRRGW